MKKKVFILSLIFMVIDQIIKVVVDVNLVNELEIIPNFFSLFKAHNNGAAFSLFSGNVIFLIIINIVIFIFLCSYMKEFKNNLKSVVAFGLVFGGLLGNLIDRIRLGYVIDYLKFDFGSYTFPIFNFADMCLCIGMGLIVIFVLNKEQV